jgi:hypothetical protein
MIGVEDARAALWGGIMPVFVVLRGLTVRGARWGAVPLLAAIVLGGAGTRAEAATSVSVAGVGTASPVLRQVGTATWETTVLVSNISSSCAQATVQYRLATRPNGALITAGVPGPAETVAGTGSAGSACQVTVTFSNLKRVPTTAALVVDDSGASASVTLTVSRNVTLASYLGVPALVGGIAVGLYVLLLQLFVTTYDWPGLEHRLLGGQDRKYLLFDQAWWGHPVTGSGAWTAGDSWATNISTGLVVVGTFLAATTASSSLFPGVALDRFAIVNIVAGVFVVAAPLLFAILYAYFTARNPGPSADSVVKVQTGTHVILRVPSGATMTVVAAASVSGGSQDSVPAGSSYLIPPGSAMAITPEAVAPAVAVKTIAFSGTSDIGVLADTIVRVGPEGDSPVVADELPTRIGVTDGAKITVTGTAGVNLPGGTVISGPRRPAGHPSRTDRWLLLPQGSSVLVGKMGFMIAANILTVFGIGAELGIAFVLAGFSDATGPWGGAIYAGLAVLASFVLGYAISATRAMANPQPGSALSAQAGTSFTL